MRGIIPDLQVTKTGEAIANADETFARALEAGAQQVYPPADQFYGDRAGRVRDPFGHHRIVVVSATGRRHAARGSAVGSR